MRAVLAVGLFDHFVCFYQRRAGASLPTARGSLTPGPTCYRSHAAIRGSRMDRRRGPTVAVQRQRRLWLRLIVANPGPILTIRAGRSRRRRDADAMHFCLRCGCFLVDHVLFSQVLIVRKTAIGGKVVIRVLRPKDCRDPSMQGVLECAPTIRNAQSAVR
jgi:hypothetical protein